MNSFATQKTLISGYFVVRKESDVYTSSLLSFGPVHVFCNDFTLQFAEPVVVAIEVEETIVGIAVSNVLIR